MNRVPIKGERIVYIGKSKRITVDFKGYKEVEIDKIYTIKSTMNITQYEPDDINNCAVYLEGIDGFGYATDCFISLEEHRISKLNKLLD